VYFEVWTVMNQKIHQVDFGGAAIKAVDTPPIGVGRAEAPACSVKVGVSTIPTRCLESLDVWWLSSMSGARLLAAVTSALAAPPCVRRLVKTVVDARPSCGPQSSWRAGATSPYRASLLNLRRDVSAGGEHHGPTEILYPA